MTALCRMRKHVSIMQISALQAVTFSLDGTNKRQVLSVPASIKGLDACAERALIWTEDEAYVFVLESGSCAMVKIVGNASMAIHNNNLYYSDEETVKVISCTGITLRVMYVDEREGRGVSLDCCDDFLALVTSNGYIRLWRMEGTDLIPSGGSRIKAIQNIPYVSLRCNCNGSKLSLILKKTDLDVHIYVYDTSLDIVISYDLRALPVTHFWDMEDPNLLACETMNFEENLQELNILSVSSERGILSQCQISLDSKSELLGLFSPYMYLTSSDLNIEDHVEKLYQRIPMPFFQEMVDLDNQVRDRLQKLLYNIACGETREAEEAIDCIEDKSICKSLARFYTKSKVLEPALYCVAKIEASMLPRWTEDELQNLACVATRLGLLDDVEIMYKRFQRYDLLNFFYQAGDIASVVRVHCYFSDYKAAADAALSFNDKPAMFQIARELKRNESIEEAIQLFSRADLMVRSGRYYENKGMHEEAVLLYQKSIADDLDESADPALLARCGDYLMSNNQVEKAVILYIAAKEHDRALEHCIKGATVTDKIAEHFSAKSSHSDSGHYKQTILTLAECCDAQGLYHLACKKYSHAGESVKAMKDTAVRIGDVYALLVEFYVSEGNMTHAYDLILKMKQRHIAIDFYVDKQIIDNVYNALGINDSIFQEDMISK
ncbi:intraflagellar transport 140 [Selaginella moellendorffii]|uniref:Intraflagellar transport 140 n=1 Tax=Selaginella moellendorffii TaxID=88036 RepID=D8SE65_SELML|nr:intraflagellar transport 140 [Selaginella moellendorffii]